METERFNIEKHHKNKKIIIYGASVWGELAYFGLRQMGLKPDFFCDQSEKRKLYFNTEVITIDKLKTDYSEEDIIIASADFFYEIKDMLEGIGCSNLFDMYDILNQEMKESDMSNRARDMYANRKHYIDVVCNQGAGRIILARLQYVVTECCSLKCRDCSYLMPYYDRPENIDLNKYKSSFERFLDITDYLAELRILGGEPMVNNEFYKLILWYVGNNKIGKISVFTNGTLIPDEKILDTMKDPKVSVHISDYGINQDRIGLLKEKLDEKGIRYFIRSYDKWLSTGGFEDRGSTDEELSNRFKNCFERSGYTFLKGKVFRCPRGAHAINLHALPDFSVDYVDFNDTDKSHQELKRDFRKLHSRKFLETCRYCSGADMHDSGIPAGIQVKENIPYEKVGKTD